MYYKLILQHNKQSNYSMQIDSLSEQPSGRQQKKTLTLQIIDNRFQIKDLGEVYVCWDRENQEVIAAKMISKVKFFSYIGINSTRSKTKQFFIKSLHNEAIRMNSLNHENILKLYGYTQTNNSLYFFTKYCNQGTLLSMIEKKSPVLKQKTISLMKQMIKACQYLHKRRICHRDIKPYNILVHNGVIKLSHFSSSLCLDDVEESESMNLLAENTEFMAPELHNRCAYTLKSDIWSLGVTFFYMLYGRSPWPHVSNQNHWHKRLLSSLKMPQNVKQPQWLQLIIQRMLVYEYELRPSIEQIGHVFGKN